MPSLDDFTFIEKASFYTKKEITEKDMNNIIKDLFNDILDKGVEGEKYIDIRRAQNDDIVYSILAYKRLTRPTCIDRNVQLDKKWLERKFAYLFIIEYDEYVVISKRNIPSIKKLRDNLKMINYEVLRSALLKEDVKFQRFGMSNTDISTASIRSKMVEANNLKDVFPTIGANTFKLNSYRMELPQENGHAGSLISVTMDSSKINQIGIHANWQDFINWVKKMINEIKSYSGNDKDSFLSVFAQPVHYLLEYDSEKLVPNALLIQIFNLINDNSIVRITCRDEETGEDEELNKTKLYEKYSKALDVHPNETGTYDICLDEEIIGIINVKEEGIQIESDKLNKVTLEIENDDKISLLKYIVDNGFYIIHFEAPYLKYTNNELFKDAFLWDRLDEFMDVFEKDEKLKDIVSEKGENFDNNQSSFQHNTLFHYCENKYAKDGCIMVCDDLGTEWADYILIGKDSVKLFVAKHKALSFSASAFHEVVGQAQKNLGVFFPLSSMWDRKREKWSNNYKDSGVQTSIRRIRTEGATAEDAINLWKKALNSANYRRDVYLVIDFISKQELQEQLQMIRNGENTAKKKEAIPILWILSSFISSCQNMNIGVHITCQP